MTIRAYTVGLGARQSFSRYGFITLDPFALQINVVIMQVDAATPVLVESAHRKLATLG